MNWNTVISLANNGSPKPTKVVEKSLEEWKEILSEEAFRVTRMKGTERPGSGEFCTSFESGLYGCICCNTPLFDSTLKFESGSGWPSFTEPVAENSIRYIKDTSFGMIRVETVCNSCQAHLGHVFSDGPEPSGLRFCINSVSLIKL